RGMSSPSGSRRKETNACGLAQLLGGRPGLLADGLVDRRLVRRDGDLLWLGRRAFDDRDFDQRLVRTGLVSAVDHDRRAFLELPAEHEVRERVLDQALDRAAQR